MKTSRIANFTVGLFCFAVVVLIIVSSFTFSPPLVSDVPFPEGYRTWTHIKTGYVGPQNPQFRFIGGYHHIYANPIAMEGYESGNFPEGSVIVFDVIQATEENGNLKPGKRRHIDVMVKNSSKFAATGGWGYEEFSEGEKSKPALTPAIKSACFSCHTTQNDFVFSDLDDVNNSFIYKRQK